jgi:hypothetical protein
MWHIHITSELPLVDEHVIYHTEVLPAQTSLRESLVEVP